MKKILMTLSLAVAALIAIPVAANAQDVTTQQTNEIAKDFQKNKKDRKNCKKDRKDNDKCYCNKHKKDKKDHRRGDGRPDGRFKDSNRSNPLFKDITLTEAQQTQMKALRDSRNQAHKAAKAEKRKAKAEIDKAQAQQRKARATAYDQEIKKILTPEQYKQYEANKAAMDKGKRGARH